MDASPDERIDAYLDEIAARLSGPRARRRQILDELRDGLLEAVGDRRAADAAIEQFGPPETVAAAFAGELSIAYARRALLLLLCTGPLVGACWLFALGVAPWRSGVLVLAAGVPVLPVVAAAVALAARAVATTGPLMRRLPETGPRAAVTTTAAVAALTVLADAALAGRYLAASPHPSAAGALAVAASGIRIVTCVIIGYRACTWPAVSPRR